MPPPDGSAAPSRRNSFGETDPPVTAAEVERLKKLARQEAEARGLHYGPNKINRLVCRALARPSPEDCIRISYSDITGEDAARNVDRARRAA